MSSTLYKKIWREAARRLIKQEGPGGFPPGPSPEKNISAPAGEDDLGWDWLPRRRRIRRESRTSTRSEISLTYKG